jgi:hypothetical protein
LGAKYGSTEAKAFFSSIVPSARRLGKSNFTPEVTAMQMERTNGSFFMAFLWEVIDSVNSVDASTMQPYRSRTAAPGQDSIQTHQGT